MSLKRKAGEAATDATKKPKVNGSITAFFGAPKPSPYSKAAAAAKFDRDAWVAKLTDEQKDLLQLELDTLHESWLPHLKDVLLTPQFLDLKRFLKQELKSGKVVYPPMKDVYSGRPSSTLAFIVREVDANIHEQVSTHASQYCQGCHHRPRPLPWPQPSPRSLFLDSPANASTTISPEHLQSPQDRLSRLQASAKPERSVDPMGRSWCSAHQHLLDSSQG
jgi:uracil-DNA glycosylase